MNQEKFIPPNLFSLDGKTFEDAIIFKIYDGDTMRMAVDFHGEPTSFKLRINGIDTPEIKAESKVEKELAIKTRNEVVKLFYLKKCKVCCYKFDKYGRVLADVVSPQGIDLATYLIDNNMAVKYDGGEKTKVWSE